MATEKEERNRKGKKTYCCVGGLFLDLPPHFAVAGSRAIMAGFFPGDSPNCATAHYFYSLLPPFPKLMTFLFPPPPRFRSTCDDDATSTVILLRRSIPLRSQTLRKVFFVVPLPRFSPPSFVSFFGISDPLPSLIVGHFLNPI